MKKIITSVKLALVLLVSIGNGFASAQEAVVGSVEVLDECFTEVAAPEGVEYDCGYLVVPEHHNVVNERSSKIAFVRLKTPSDSPGAPLFKTHGGPGRDSESWCQYIDKIVRERHTPSGSDKDFGTAAMAQGPSYDCDKLKPGSIEAMICEDEELSALDREPAAVNAAASKKAVSERPSQLTAEQRGWIKGRNECWKSDDKRGCVQGEY